MKRRMMLFAGMLMGSWMSVQAATATVIPTAPPVAMPEPSNLPELGLSLSALLGYCWWRISRTKRRDS